MNLWELLLLLMVGWTALGVLGLAISLVRGEREHIGRGLRWLAGVWAVYLVVVVVVSLVQKQRVVAMGQEQCFDEMCFTVTGVDEVPGFLVHDGRRLLRVSVRITNRGHKPESEALIRAYLVDAQGRLWGESPGLSGVRLTAKVGPAQSAVSQPVFDVSADASGLGLVFTHGQHQPGVLVIGDSDSLLHRRTVVPLER
jgi:hypothetical protein